MLTELGAHCLGYGVKGVLKVVKQPKLMYTRTSEEAYHAQYHICHDGTSVTAALYLVLLCCHMTIALYVYVIVSHCIVLNGC